MSCKLSPELNAYVSQMLDEGRLEQFVEQAMRKIMQHINGARDAEEMQQLKLVGSAIN